MKISIIIPTFNESGSIYKLIAYLLRYGAGFLEDIVVSDGGSHDETISIASTAGAKAVLSPLRGRSAQMNYGVSLAKADILYFVHADSFPPQNFANDIIEAVKSGYGFGRYQTKFDSNRTILKLNAFFTRFDLFICYGGDQTLFITKKLFTELNGFDSNMKIMEEYDLVKRAKVKASYKIFSGKAIISARKYKTNSWWQVQRANYTIVRMFKKGASQNEMIEVYRRMLKYR